MVIAAVLHRSTATQNAPKPKRTSGGAFKAWTAKPGHLIENWDGNLGFCFLTFEVAPLLLGPNDGFPAAHQSFAPAVLIVTSGFLPGHPPVDCDVGDMAVSCRRIVGRIRAQDCVFGRWDRHLDHRSEPSGKQIRCWFSVVSAVCQKQINRTVDLIQEVWQCRWIANVVRG